jgi:hypothetical protein
VALGKIRGWEGLVLDDEKQGELAGQGGYPMDFYSVSRDPQAILIDFLTGCLIAGRFSWSVDTQVWNGSTKASRDKGGPASLSVNVVMIRSVPVRARIQRCDHPPSGP